MASLALSLSGATISQPWAASPAQWPERNVTVPELIVVPSGCRRRFAALEAGPASPHSAGRADENARSHEGRSPQMDLASAAALQREGISRIVAGVVGHGRCPSFRAASSTAFLSLKKDRMIAVCVVRCFQAMSFRYASTPSGKRHDFILRGCIGDKVGGNVWLVKTLLCFLTPKRLRP